MSLQASRTPMFQRLTLGGTFGRAWRLFVLVVLVGTLSACGGDDGSDGVEGEPPDGGNGPPPISADLADPSEVCSGGGTLSSNGSCSRGNTVNLSNDDAFTKSNPLLGFIDQGKFESGDSEFGGARQGLLGPLFNNGTCQECHKKDGRGNPPKDIDNDGETDQHMGSMLVRLSIPVLDPSHPVVVQGGVQPEPVYGGQIQVRGGVGTPGHPSCPPYPFDSPPSDDLEDVIGEACVSILYRIIPGAYEDGTPYYLQQPTYRVHDLAYGPFCGDEPDCRHDEVQFSPRVAPPAFGLGLLEAIPESDILKFADPNDLNTDGISGRPNWVWNVCTEFRGQACTAETGHLGRFGHKASKATILHQLAAAYVGDLGLTSRLFPEHTCTAYQPDCEVLAERQRPAGMAWEIDDLTLALVEFYMRQLAVPKRRGWDAETQYWEPQIRRGRQLFFRANCSGCHVPRHVTGKADGSVLGEVVATLDGLREPTDPLPRLASLSDLVIWPYTDLLLHDMGGSCDVVVREGDDGGPCADEAAASCVWVQTCDGLADGRPDFLASGSEWRTPPLWGLGLAKTVNPDAGFLHDGRARTIEEAILWHGHENSEARDAWEFFVGLSRSQREDLLAFLESL